MDKYFELREKGETLYGIIENIPSSITDEEIIERINSTDEHSSIEIVNKKFAEPELIMDWTTIDFEQGLDPNFIDVSDCLSEAIEYGLETEVVYTALQTMKEYPQLSISEAIKVGLNEWMK